MQPEPSDPLTRVSRRCDVAVVGAGLAGLAAARVLSAHGLEVAVLEARDRVGGRILNHRLPDGQLVEIGGQWVGATQRRILGLIEELGLETFPTYDEGDKLFELRDRVVRYRGSVPRVGPLGLADIAQSQLRLDRMARTVSPERPWEARRAAAWDRQTLAGWVRRNARTRVGRAFWALVCEAVWAVDPADVSLLHVLFYTRSAGGIGALIGTEGGAQERRVVGGSQLIAQRLADGLDGRVRLGETVRRIDHGEGVCVQTDASSFSARMAIVAIPPALAGRLDYRPQLRGDRDQLTQRVAQGSVVKSLSVYPEPFWRRDGLSGQVTSAEGPVKVVFDNTPRSGRPGVLVSFLEGNQARRFGVRPPAERRAAVLACLERFFGAPAARPSEFVDLVWADEPFSRGCYGAFLPPGAWTAHGRALRAPIGCLHWAGAETATTWSGYMDGAVSSGERAAREVVAQLDRRS